MLDDVRLWFDDSTSSHATASATARSRRVTAASAFLILVTLALTASQCTDSHRWGDDWAGYMLQARALADGNARSEVNLNGWLIAHSDRRVGPDAYPWGVPALLALVAGVAGWDVNALKVLGGIFAVLLAVFHVRLLRQLALSPLGVVACTAIVLWQPPLLREADNIGSDLPFLAVSGLYLSLMVTLLQLHRASGRIHGGLFGVAAFTAAVSFSIRSNGVILLGVTVLIGLYCVVTSHAVTKGRALVGLAVFTGALLLGYTLFFVLLPDGMAVHLALLYPEPGRYSRRAYEIVGDLTQFMPMRWLPDNVDHFAVLALAPLAALGARSMGATGLLLGSTLLAHTVLLLLFPVSDGPRYYYPLLGPLALLCWSGAATCGAHLGEHWPLTQNLRRRLAQGLQSALVVAAIVTVFRSDFSTSERVHGPLSPSFRQLTDAVSRNLAPNQRISFFRPRAMRWFSGRQALAVTEADNLALVDAVALYLRLAPGEAPSLQPDEQLLAGSGRFALAFQNADFKLYVRLGPGYSTSDRELSESPER